MNDSRSHPRHRKLPVAPRMFLTLAADGTSDAEDQRSRVRTGFVLFISILVLVAAPLYWTASAQGGKQDEPQAVAVKSEDDDDDHDEDGDDNSGTGGSDSGTGGNDPGTGAETQIAKTDRAGAGALTQGASTRGETDPGDHTGKTERR